jgi:hypothetical protein
MWKNISYIVRNNIEFTQLISDRAKNKFISQIADSLYEIIYLIEKKLVAVKTNTSRIVNDKKKVFMTIYTWALLIKIVLENAGKIQFTSPKKLSTAKDMFAFARSRMLNSLNVVFKDLPDMELTDKFLDNSLHKSYQSLSTYLSKSKIQEYDVQNTMNVLEHDPIYTYIARMRGLIKLYKSDSSDVATVRRIMNKAMTPEVAIGKSRSDVENPKNSAGSSLIKGIPPIKMPEYHSESRERKGGNSLERFVEVRREAYSQVVSESIDFLLYYVQGRSYLESGYVVDITRTGASFKIVTTPKESQRELDKRSAQILLVENNMWFLTKYFFMRAYSLSPYNHGHQYHDVVGSNSLALVFGYEINDAKYLKNVLKGELRDAHTKSRDTFHKHKWSISMYVDSNAFRPGKTLEDYKTSDVHVLSSKDAAKFYGDSYESNPFKLKYKYIGSMCQICFHEWSGAEEKIRDVVKYSEREKEMINFYRYFEFQCPNPSKEQNAKGEQSHEYARGSAELNMHRKCRNCGFQKSYAEDRDLSYYKKYVSTYVKERKSERKSVVVPTHSAHGPAKVKVNAEIKSWKPSLSIANEVTDATYDWVEKGSSLPEGLKHMKINKREYGNIINNLGLFERVEFDDILKGKESPYKELTPAMAETRTINLGALIRELIYEYTAIKNYENISKPGKALKELMNSAKPGDLATLRGMPNVDELTPLQMNYYNACEQMDTRTYDDPVLASQFQMYYLCALLLGIVRWARKSKMDKNFEREFVLYFVGAIISAERVFSAAKAARLAALEAVQAAQGVDTVNDANNIDNRQSRMYDDLVDPEYEDKFSFSGMDYDGHNDDINT